MDNGREDKNPWVKWYWSDWVADTGLRLCGLGAKGLWADMLSYMARSKKRGYLMIGDQPMDNKDLSKLVHESEDTVNTLMAELRSHDVYSVTSDGLIYNRRMVREAAILEAKSQAGKKGMKSRWGNNKPHNKGITGVYNKTITDSASAYASASSSPNPEVKEEGGRGEEQPNPEDVRLVQLLIDLIQKNNPKSKVARMTTNAQKTWLNQCRLLREMDGRNPTEIETVIRWCQEDEFWRVNILSMTKLREKFDRLWLKSHGAPSKGVSLDGIKEFGKRHGVLFNEEK